MVTVSAIIGGIVAAVVVVVILIAVIIVVGHCQKYITFFLLSIASSGHSHMQTKRYVPFSCYLFLAA